MTTNQIAESKSILHLLDPKKLHPHFKNIEPGMHDRIHEVIAPTVNNISEQADEIARKMLEANPEFKNPSTDPILKAA